MAYALSRFYQQRGCLTVLGGPHAHSFPEDAERFFDVIVGACNEELIREILVDRPRGVELSSEPPKHFPTVQERMEDIRNALFYRGYPLLASTIPLYASVGCPYTCDFCIDYDSRYRTLDVSTLEEDLRFINAHYPNVTIAFHDANFGVRFDETLSVLEKVNNRTRYGVGLTMSVLSNPERVSGYATLVVATYNAVLNHWPDSTQNKGGSATFHLAKRKQRPKISFAAWPRISR